MNTNVCGCGRKKSYVSKRCAQCNDKLRTARAKRSRTCKCGGLKTDSAERCWDCRIEVQATLRCACGARTSSSQSKTCFDCRAKAPTKVKQSRLDYLRAWRKLHPKGPPCSVCGEKLAEKSKSARPLCMGCRASTGQLQQSLQGKKCA